MINELIKFLDPGPWFNIKVLSYQYRKSHCGDKTILRPSYLHNGISYTGKRTSLYWIRAQVVTSNATTILLTFPCVISDLSWNISKIRLSVNPFVCNTANRDKNKRTNACVNIHCNLCGKNWTHTILVYRTNFHLFNFTRHVGMARIFFTLETKNMGTNFNKIGIKMPQFSYWKCIWKCHL